MIVTGNYIFCLKSGIVIGRKAKERNSGRQYAVETVRGSRAKYRLTAEDKDGQPVHIDAEVAAEVIDALTVLSTPPEDPKDMAVLFASAPDQTRLQELWNSNDLWRYFIFVTNRPQTKPKPKPKPVRIASALAGAIRTAVIEEKETGGGVETTQIALPADTKRLLMVLAQHIPANACTYGPDLFGTWQHIGIRQNDLKTIARSIYGKSGPEQLQNLLQALCRAAATSVTSVHMVEKKGKGKARRGRVSVESGSFIGIHNLPYHRDERGGIIYEVPDLLDISLHNVFGYWLTRFYGVADIQAIIDRSRSKNGLEYMAIRLWGLEIAPKIAAATKEAAHTEVFRLADLRQPNESTYTADDRRARCIAVAAEAAKDMGATYIGLERKKTNGGEAITGLRFQWEKSLQMIGNEAPLTEG